MVDGPDKNGLYTFKNGAKAKKLKNGRYQIVKGVSKSKMADMRKKRGKKGSAPRRKTGRRLTATGINKLLKEAYLTKHKGDKAAATRGLRKDINTSMSPEKTMSPRSLHVAKNRRKVRKPSWLLTHDIKHVDDGSAKAKARRGNLKVGGSKKKATPKRKTSKRRKNSKSRSTKTISNSYWLW